MFSPTIIEHQEKIGIGTVNVAGAAQMIADLRALSADWFYNWSPTLPAEDVEGWFVGAGGSIVGDGIGNALRLAGSDGWAVQTVKVTGGSSLMVSFDAHLLAGSGGVVVEYLNAAGKVVSSSFAQLAAGAARHTMTATTTIEVVAARIVTYAAPTGDVKFDNFALADDSGTQIINGGFETQPQTVIATPGFVPMIWNGAQISKLAGIASAHPGEALLTFNEPDNAAQANMTVAQALSYWPALMASGMRLGSPAVTFGNTLGAKSWLGQFMSAADASGYRVDFIAVHYYNTNPSVEDFAQFLKSVHETYGRPVWVTEWSLADWSNTDRFTAEQQAAFFAAATQMMDDLPFVERHAWFSAYEGMDSYFLNSGLIDTGALSVVGRAFEVAATSGGHATPLGTDRNDTLIGSARNEEIFGFNGNDTIEGRGGADRIDGGQGIDLGSYAASADGVEIDLTAPLQKGGDAEGDVLINVEDVHGSDHDDVLKGNASANVLYGSAGSDQIYGGKGNDTLYGSGGNDTLDGQGGADHLDGGAGDDVYYVDSSRDQTIELAGEGVDAVHAYLSWTLAAETETLYLRSSANLNGTGNTLANTIIGNSGANRLEGRDGNDRLEGRGGNDILVGGSGDDTLIGGTGSDVFIFAAGDGHDVIADFAPGSERVEIYGFTKADAVLHQAGTDTLIEIGEGSILLLNIQATDLNSENLLFLV